MVSTEPRSLFPGADDGAIEDAREVPAVAAPEPTSMAEIGLPDQIVIDLTLKLSLPALGVGSRGEPAQAAVRALRVVLDPPVLDQHLRLEQAVELLD